MNRREFIGTAAGALAASRSWSIGAAQGANDRIRVIEASFPADYMMSVTPRHPTL